ncbi:hypothetical protein C0V73_00035 [Rhizobium sp. TH135]|uniref:hypothetical protein n=1 Tax=Rhizobium sp. TH135 TaxID=2067451 RepID=UPI000C7D8FC3|nr:hypothetical protein [Rhizobium sp. TH135]PLK72266.1 hypothetical protein C0V73_00035 [Rhizobium sp. TH135]
MHYSNDRDDFAEKTRRLENFFDGEQVAASPEFIVTKNCGVAQSILDEIAALDFSEDESCETVQLFEAQEEPEPYFPQPEEPASKGEGVVSPSPLSLPLPTTTLTPEASDLAAIFTDLDKPTTSPRAPIVRPPSLLDTIRKAEENRKTRQREADDKRAAQVMPIRRQWCSLTPEQRLLLTFRFAAQRDGLALTLQFSKANEARLRKSDDPARALSRSLNRALKKHLGHALEYAFAFEFSPLTGKLHAHGVIIPGAHDPDQIRAALYSTTGKAESKYGQGRMVELVPISDSTGWHGYTLKDFAKTGERLAGKPYFITESFRREAEAWHGSKKATAARPRVSKASPANDSAKPRRLPAARYESKKPTRSQAPVRRDCSARIVTLGCRKNNLKRIPYEAARSYPGTDRRIWRGTG